MEAGMTKALYEPPHVVHFFKPNGHDGRLKSFFYGTYEFATLPEGIFTICIREEILDAKILYLDADSGHFVATLQFRTLPGFPARDRVAQHIAAFDSHLEPVPTDDDEEF